MTVPPEAKALQAALHALNHPPDPTHLAALSRAVTRAADDLELVAEETSNRSVRKAFLVEVSRARTAVTAARRRAREAALTIDRSQLFESSQKPLIEETETDAARLARKINDSLRRTTAIVSEEIDRSRVAGDIVEQSTRRLRMTRDQHGNFNESLSSGAVTLKSIRRTEMIANVLIIASFAIFFLTAAYVTRRRIANSNISTFVFRPGMKVASIPLRLAAWMLRSIGGLTAKGEPSELSETKIASTSQKQEETVRAKEGREKVQTSREEQNDQNREDIKVLHSDTAPPEENDTCQTENKFMSTDADGVKRPTEQSVEATVTSGDHNRAGNESPKFQEPKGLSEDASRAILSDANADKSESVRSDEINGETSGSDDASADEDARFSQLKDKESADRPDDTTDEELKERVVREEEDHRLRDREGGAKSDP